MISRYIQAALTKGWAAYQAGGLALYSDLFSRTYDLSLKEVESIRDYFARLPPKILQGYPRDEIDQRPSCYIFNATASQPGFALNDFGGFGGAPTTPAAAGFQAPGVVQQAANIAATGVGGAAFILSSLWTHQFQILGLARGAPEPVMWMTEIHKSILLAAKNFFLAKAMQSVVLSTSDVQFREDLAPSDLFACAITLQCGREFSQADTSQALQQAFRLDGLIGPEGSDTHGPGRPISRIVVTEPKS